MTDGPLVSVVTPVYNGEQFLAECIESVLNQTYTNWEYVLVDNVSTDGTGSIADRFAARDARIRVVHATEFVDVHANHNRCLQAMDPRSRYCKFVEADDWLYPECLARMVAVAEAHPEVGIVGSFCLEGTNVARDGLIPYDQTVVPGGDVVRWELLDQGWLTGTPTALLLRADVTREPAEFYDTTFWHADTDAAHRVLMASDFGFVHQVLTFNRWHPGALTQFSHRVWSFIARDGGLLLRYGVKVLSPGEYRTRKRQWLRRYGLFLAKRIYTPRRHPDSEFREFHRTEMDKLIAAARDDTEIQNVLRLYRRVFLSSRALNQASTGAERDLTTDVEHSRRGPVHD